MFKKTFIRLILLGTITFALFFLFISVNKAQTIPAPDCIETGTANENTYPQGEFILETMIGAISIGIN